MQEEEGIENGWMYGLFPSHPERSLAIARFAVDRFILPSLTINTPQRLEKSFEGQILNPSMDTLYSKISLYTLTKQQSHQKLVILSTALHINTSF